MFSGAADLPADRRRRARSWCPRSGSSTMGILSSGNGPTASRRPGRRARRGRGRRARRCSAEAPAGSKPAPRCRHRRRATSRRRRPARRAGARASAGASAAGAADGRGPRDSARRCRPGAVALRPRSQAGCRNSGHGARSCRLTHLGRGSSQIEGERGRGPCLVPLARRSKEAAMATTAPIHRDPTRRHHGRARAAGGGLESRPTPRRWGSRVRDDDVRALDVQREPRQRKGRAGRARAGARLRRHRAAARRHVGVPQRATRSAPSRSARSARSGSPSGR